MSPAGSQRGLVITTSSTPTGDMIGLMPNSTTVTKSRIDKNATFITAVNAAPADADISANEAAWWFDSTTGSPKVNFRVKDAAGTASTIQAGGGGGAGGTVSIAKIEALV